MSREDILTALLAQISTDQPFQTVGRRLILWSQCKAQPALFLRHVGDLYPPRATGIPPKVTIECEAWIYSDAGRNSDDAPEIAINNLVDRVEQAIQPTLPYGTQTLGGLVTHCWIEGRIEIHPGDLDGQAIAIIPIRALCPTLVIANPGI